MTGTIYLIHDTGGLVELTEQPYNSEDLLQRFLATHPSLLAGDQIDHDAPRKWLLIRREAPVPSEAGSVGRWALDHLLLDQDAIPTLVEVKRSSDTRIRREVIGQMLDYAANAVVYWSVETIRAQFEALCAAAGRDPDQALIEFLGEESEPEVYWQQVKTNLLAGKIRMLFVADEIPPELRRVVEFLNTQMNPAEVLAVEIKQYVGEGLRTLVPRVIGQTAATQQQKGGTRQPGRQWDEATFFEDLGQRQGPEVVEAVRKILAWSRANATRIWWGKGMTYGSLIPVLDHKKRGHQLFAVFGTGAIEIYFQWYAQKPPFDDEAKRLELRDRLNAIPGVRIPADALLRRPSFPASLLRDPKALDQFLSTFDWYLQEVRAS